MRFSKICLIVLIAFPVLVQAQQWKDYQPIEANNPIPEEFLTLSSDKYEQAKEQLSSERDEKKTKQDFLLESNFLIDQVLSSGRVLFNDPVSDYLNKVMDVILVDDLELRKKIRVYALQSSVVNSFTTDDGIILVNLGLLAQLENEAQLAFILCHELVHYTENHVINAYVENQQIKHGKGEYKRSTFDERMLARSRYSKDLEKDADRIGLERFLTTPYGTSSLLNVFEVMRYAHLPFDDIPFDKSFFNEGYYQVDDSYFLNRVRPVETSGNGKSGHDTHPNPSERQQLMRSYLSRTNTSRKSNYLVSEPEFHRLRELARFELSNLYLNANEPVKCVYNAFLLLQNHPNNDYLKKSIAHALYTLSKFKTGGNYGYVHPGFSQIEGESQQVYHLLYRLEPQELCILATGYLWRLKDQYPNDKDIEVMSNDLFADLMTNYYVPGMFAQTKPTEGWNKLDTTIAIKGKYDRLKQKSKSNPHLAMVKYALVDLFENATFTEEFENLERKVWGNSEHFTEKEIRKKTKLDVRQWKNHGFALGAEKVVVVS
ncbi:MAG: M48 family metallopeptidase, partial [Flavobacteriales bacterium]|nr:M48 family metallopeptidase [Flavobacteriales bacterium]